MFVSCPVVFFCMYKFTIRSSSSCFCCFIFGTFFYYRYFFGACLLNLHCFCFSCCCCWRWYWYYVLFAQNFDAITFGANIILSILAGWLTAWLVCLWILYTHGWWLSYFRWMMLLFCWCCLLAKKIWHGSEKKNRQSLCECVYGERGSHLKMVHHQ